MKIHRRFALALMSVIAVAACALTPAEPTGISIGSAPVKSHANGAKLKDYARVSMRAPKHSPRSYAPPKGRSESERWPLGHGLGFHQTAAPEPAARAPGRAMAPSPVTVGAGFTGIDEQSQVIPPDTMGAVGLNHVMTVTNDYIDIRDRDGVEVNGTHITLNDFFSPLSQSAMDAFDPKILYDPGTSRWYFTALAYPDSTSSGVMLAVSDGSDPTSTWSLFGVDIAGMTNWADYPSIGFNKDWIVIQVNMFAVGSGNPAGSNIYVFRKARLFAGQATCTGIDVCVHYKKFTDTDGFAQAPATVYGSSIGTIYLVEDWWGHLDGGDGNFYGVLRITRISGAVGAETYTTGDNADFAATLSTWDDGIGIDNFADQSGGLPQIATGDSRMQNCVYRNGSIWCAHTIYLPDSGTPDHTAVQWWQISPTGSVLQRGRIEDTDGTSPQLFYAFPSIAVNANNDALIGYARFGSDQFASAAYRYRSGSDPANTLRDEATLKAGAAHYDQDLGFGVNRWGDYSATVVDPRNDADFWTIQEYATAPMDLWGTWWGHIASASFSAPTLTGGITAKFSSDVTNVVGGDNFVVTGPGGAMTGTYTCKNASGTDLPDCTTGVRSVTLMPPSPLTPGGTYTPAINPGTASSTIKTGGFDVAPATAALRGQLWQEESSIAATPKWRSFVTSSAMGGSYLADHKRGASVAFTFTGRAITWYAAQGPNYGNADVYIDGTKIGTYNMYSSTGKFGVARTFNTTNGTHTIKIVAGGAKGTAAATDTYISVDAFRVYTTTGNSLYTSPTVTFQWPSFAAASASGGRYALGDVKGSSYDFIFRGSGIDLYTVKSAFSGKMSIYIDGVLKSTYDDYAASTIYNVKVSFRGLNGNQHTMRIVVAGAKNTASKGYNVNIDRWIVI